MTVLTTTVTFPDDVSAEPVAGPNLFVYQGEVVAWKVNVLTGVDPLDLTGSEAYLAVYQEGDDTNTLFYQSGAEIDFGTPTGGVMTITFSNGDTQTILGNWLYELRLNSDVLGQDRVLLSGKLVFTASATKGEAGC